MAGPTSLWQHWFEALLKISPSSTRQISSTHRQPNQHLFLSLLRVQL